MADDERTDEELFSAAQRGDSAAFAALCRRHLPVARRAAFAVLASWPTAWPEAEDAAQDALVGFADCVRELPSNSSPRAIIGRLAVCAAWKRRTKLRRGREHDADVDPPAPNDPVSDPTRRECVRAAVESLPQPHRDVIRLRFWVALSLDEIAAALKIPLGTVKSRLHSAAQALRRDPDLCGLFKA